jgi:hypothetical protein
MFDRLARRRVRQKMVRGQAAAAGLATSLLMVDLAEFPLAEEWEHGFYRRSFEASLARHVARDLMGHDAVAFCDAPSPDKRLRLRSALIVETAPDGLTSLLRRLAHSDGG